jgi:hypothetical protein
MNGIAVAGATARHPGARAKPAEHNTLTALSCTVAEHRGARIVGNLPCRQLTASGPMRRRRSSLLVYTVIVARRSSQVFLQRRQTSAQTRQCSW